METEEIVKLQEELNSLFATMQKIDAPMTENNVAVMNACLGSVKFIYKELEELKKERGSDNGNVDAE